MQYFHTITLSHKIMCRMFANMQKKYYLCAEFCVKIIINHKKTTYLCLKINQKVCLHWH